MNRIFYSFVFALFALFLIFSGCSKNDGKGKTNTTDNEIFDQYILDYTRGEINVSESLRIVFKRDMVKQEDLAKELNTEFFKSDPQVQGKLFWETESILSFQPDRLAFDQEYHFSANLRKILDNQDIDLPDKNFHFNIHTFPLDFEVIYQPMEIYADENGQSKMLLKGVVSFNSVIDSGLVLKMMEIDTDGQNPFVQWEHHGNRHDFNITHLEKKPDVEAFTLRWKIEGSKGEAEEKRFLIPAKGDFEIIEASISTGNPREIFINFSDFLDKSQEFKGLASLQDVQVEPEYYVNANILRIIYPGDLSGELTLKVEKTIRSQAKAKLKRSFSSILHFSAPKPALKLINSGTICADVDEVIFPFEAINLHAVDVEIVKVYQNNMMQYLQYNTLNDPYLSNEVSEIIWQGKVELKALSNAAIINEWHRYGLNLMELVKLETGALYNVRIGFRKQYTQYPCETDHSKAFEEAGIGELESLEEGHFNSIWKGWYSYPNRRWTDREDPCLPMYYTYDNFIQQNVLASNMGLLAKYDGEDHIFLSVVDLKSARARGGVKLSVYSFQQQLLSEGISDEDGILQLKVGHKAYFIIAQDGNEYGYLKLNEYQPLSMSDFDIQGKQQVRGVDGYIFGERGVWRPGDSMYLNFVLKDMEGKLPQDPAINFELFDPMGKSFYKVSTIEHQGPFYTFICQTDHNSPTGNWRARVQAGPHTFEKTIKIETVKPNRLKIDLNLGEGNLELNKSTIPVEVKWLTGIPGNGLRVNVDLDLKQSKTSFSKYKDFTFDDVSRKFRSRELKLFDGQLNEDGKANIEMSLNQNYLFPGKMKATFKVRAYEKSGEFSSNSFQGDLSPYSSYAGVYVPKTSWGSASLEIDKNYKIPVVALDQEGKVLPGRKLSVGIYKTKWRWWWDDSGNELAQFNSDQHLMAFRKESLVTGDDGKALMPLELEDYGSYMIRVCDEESGHCSGEMFYAGYYGGDEEGSDFASKLHFKSDKKSYKKGETIELSIPAGKGSRALVTLETAGKVLKSEWLESDGDLLSYRFASTAEMFPNVYAHVTMIQGIENKVSDLPLRRYGVLNIEIQDPEKLLQPELKMKDELKPNSLYTVEVSEKEGKEMNYVLAVVDEGLLDLTNFKTPSLYDHFYSRQALLTKNWDNFNEVIQGKAAMFDKIISIGGDDEVVLNNDANKANRFVPVVRFEGPFNLKKGKKARHELDMPNYSGAVRAMVIAAGDEAYGSAEKSVVVKEDLMALLTAPRVLSPGESIDLPVSLFVSDDKIKDVEVKLSSNEHFEIVGDQAKLVQFDKPGEKLVYFSCQVKEKEGIGKLKVEASSLKEVSIQHVEIGISNPNSYQRSANSFVLAAGEEREIKLPIIGMEGTNNAVLELSQMPSLEMENRIAYLINYPYGCVEQTTSAVFPQLFLDKLADLSQDRKNQIKINIIQGIDRLRSFQNAQNGMGYWPGDQVASSWGSVYAAHFLVEAKLKGYNTGAVLPGLLNYLKNVSKGYRFSKQEQNQSIPQAYRVMVLARAGKPDFGSMNYLYKLEDLPPLAKSYLSLAYSYAGKNDIAGRLLSNTEPFIAYRSTSLTYGSNLRDYAVLLQALDQAKLTSRSAQLMKDMITLYKSKSWWNTQTLSWFFMSVAKMTESQGGEINALVQHAGGDFESKTKRPLQTIDLAERYMDAPVRIKNQGASTLFVSYVSQGKPRTGFEGNDESNNLVFNVEYRDKNGQVMDIDEISMGSEFKAIVNIRQNGMLKNVDEMALNQIFPSGWEILNWRMDGSSDENRSLDYQDIRDDRVYSFFDLRGKDIRIEIPLHASYAGNFFLPQQYVEAMYDDEVYGKKAGKWVKVNRN